MALFKVELISQFRMTHFIEADTCEEAEHFAVNGGTDEASQVFLGDTVFSCQKIKRKHFERWLENEKESYGTNCAHWLGDDLIQQADTVCEDPVAKAAFRNMGTSLILNSET